MFRGTIPESVQRIMAEHVCNWDCSDIYVGCSGNFTVERVLASVGSFELHSNDVTLHSSALGWLFSGETYNLTLAEQYKDVFGWISPFLDTSLNKTASVLLAEGFMNSLSSGGTVKDNLYYSRLVGAYQAQWETMHAKTAEKLEGSSFSIKSYYCGDVVDYLETCGDNAGVVTYPPFFAGDYEDQFKKLSYLFDWDKPTYPILDESRKALFFERLVGRKHWFFGTYQPIDSLQDKHIGIAQTSNRGLTIYLYSSQGPVRVVQPFQKTAEVKCDRLMPGQQIGKSLTLGVLEYDQFQALRSEYMNPFIRPGQASMAMGVLVDGFLVGAFAFSTAPNPGQSALPSAMYLLSDFSVEPTDYPRLSKLVLYAALSRESKLIAERVSGRRIRNLYTTAFSNNPSSMKYRGLFKLHSRKETDGHGTDLHTNQRYQLNYISEMGQWSLEEGMSIWVKKHGERIATNED